MYTRLALNSETCLPLCIPSAGSQAYATVSNHVRGLKFSCLADRLHLLYNFSELLLFQPSFSLQIDFLLILCWFLFQSGSCSSLFLNYWEGLLLLISESSLSPSPSPDPMFPLACPSPPTQSLLCFSIHYQPLPAVGRASHYSLTSLLHFLPPAADDVGTSLGTGSPSSHQLSLPGQVSNAT